MVDGPPALPDLLVAVVARWTVSEVVSVQLDKPPPVTGVGTEAFTRAQAVHEHRGTKNVCVTVMISDLTWPTHLTRLEMFCIGCSPCTITKAGYSRVIPAR